MSRNVISLIARRFIFDRKGSDDEMAKGFVSFIAAISITGLALGVTALLVVTSVMNGFEKELQRTLTAFHGHVLLFSKGEPVSHPENYMKDISTHYPSVKAISPYIFAEVMLSTAHGVVGSVVEGIDLPTFSQVSEVSKRIQKGRLPEGPQEISLGEELARRLNADVGDSIFLTLPFSEIPGKSKVQKLSVVGILKLGMFDYDSKYSLIELHEMQSLLQLEGKVNAFKILTEDAGRSSRLASALSDRYTYPLRARDWSTLNQNLFYAIRLEKVVIGIILMVIILVASFNIVSTLIMMVHEKQRQIAMLKALGFGVRSTFGLFLFMGGGMALCGTALGLGVGRALCALVQWRSIIDLPPDIYMLSRLPVEIRWVEWGAICVAAIILALISTLIPSYRISKEAPAKGLRYE